MLGGVADTHALVWFALGESQKLGQRARQIFEGVDRQDGSALVTVPTVVLHEVSSLRIKNKVTLRTSFPDWVQSLATNPFLQIVDVTREMVEMSDSFQQIDDPFDRLIMGCARLFEQPLITVDGPITDSKLVEIVWD